MNEKILSLEMKWLGEIKNQVKKFDEKLIFSTCHILHYFTLFYNVTSIFQLEKKNRNVKFNEITIYSIKIL